MAEATAEDRAFDALTDETPVDNPSTEDTDSTQTPSEASDEEIVEDQGVDADTDEDASEDDSEPEGEKEPEAEFVEIEFEGKLYEVPNALQDALLRQQDYTTKTQEVSAQRKQAEVLQGELDQTKQQFEFAQSIQEDVLKAQQLEKQAEQAHQYLRDNIDDLTSIDIEKLRLAVDDARRERDQIVNSVQGKQQEFQQAQQQSHTELLDKGTEVLRQKIKGWDESHQKQVREYALGSGFTDHEISGVIDPRQVEVLWKAAQYDSLKAGAAPAVKVVQNAPAIKPKGRADKMDDAAKIRLKQNKIRKAKNLSTADRADQLMDTIADRFD